MHPRFIEFIDRQTERPHHHRQAIAFAGAFLVTALLVSGRVMFFPIDLAANNTSQIANISESINAFKTDMNAQTETIKNQVNQIGEAISGINQELGSGAGPVIPLRGDSEAAAAPSGWAPASDGGGYYEYQYPGSSGAEGATSTTTY